MTMNTTWGYKSFDNKWKSTETLIRNLADIASKNGNYLLNVGPDANGEFPQGSLTALKGIGEWMKVNGASIYATQGSPLPALDWGRCTQKKKNNTTTLYLHVFNWPTNGELHVPGVKGKVNSARLLANGKKLTTTTSTDEVVIKLPAEAPDKIDTVIEVAVSH